MAARSPTGPGQALQHEVVLADNLHAERAAGFVRIIDADHGEEQVIGDADGHQQVRVDAGVGELAERGRASAGLIFHPDGQSRTPRVLDVGAGQRCLGAGLVIDDERDRAVFPAGGRGQDQVDATAGHSLTQPGKLAGLVLQVHGEHAHLALLGPRRQGGPH